MASLPTLREMFLFKKEFDTLARLLTTYVRVPYLKGKIE